jgi:hypothetical protein
MQAIVGLLLSPEMLFSGSVNIRGVNGQKTERSIGHASSIYSSRVTAVSGIKLFFRVKHGIGLEFPYRLRPDTYQIAFGQMNDVGGEWCSPTAFFCLPGGRLFTPAILEASVFK